MKTNLDIRCLSNGMLFLVLLLSLSHPVPPRVQADPAILYVALDATCGGMTPCYTSPQDAVNAASSGDEIRIAAGVYTGINTLGGKAQLLYIDRNLTIRGGFTTANWETPYPFTNLTELQAQMMGRVVFIAEGVDTTLEGLIITWGNASGLLGSSSGSRDAGGGVYIKNSSLTLKDCDVLYNATMSNGYGGGLYAWESSIQIDNTLFQENSAESGGGVYLYQSDAIIQVSFFIENQTTGLSAGAFAIRMNEGEIELLNNYFDSNFTENGFNSAITISNADLFIDGNVILGTDGAYSQSCSGVSITNSSGIFSNNYIAYHRNTGVAVNGGYITVRDNEIAYNSGWPSSSGGGISFQDDALGSSNFILAGNYIHNNYDRYFGMGGGVYLDTRENNTAYLYHNRIESNQSGDGTLPLTGHGVGGGVYISGNYATLEGNIIQENVANTINGQGGLGGGIYITGNATLINNIITGNQAPLKGSGVYISGAAPYLYHNTLSDNKREGGDQSAIYASENSSNVPAAPHLYNTIIANQGTGIYAYKDDVTSTVNVDGILWFNNTANTGGSGMVFPAHEYSGDPMFVDPTNGDFHIGAGSAALDIGVVTTVLIDLDGEPRFGFADIGADEYWAPGTLPRIFLPIIVR